MANTIEDKVADLVELAELEGITLPFPPDMIARLEETGAVVNFSTGEIIVNGAEQRYSLTTYGEAWEHLNKLGLL